MDGLKTVNSEISPCSFSSWDKRIVKLPEKGTQVLFFISLHCLHCIDFTPSLSEIEQEFPDFNFILFSTGDESDSQVMSEYFNWKFPIVHLNKSDMERFFNITMLPYVIVIKDSIVRVSGVAYNKSDYMKLASRIVE
ncbi:thioredoxin family protein [Paenibacillus sp. sptzw28]|uniref:TlpA family protein disulfide reductase n=1 Tax=Paenibacillus sp. sptzw28 TaxID=715179 RepID=UPI001C6ED8A8|nr:thioredoxin-like domain-containing protein [Paenibacillus sp. sptzw28]QYR21111.1 thioredoxin family protein [Paenibacillus sp. sptzw28]